LREKGLTNKISVEEVLFELSKVTKIVEKSGREYFAKIPKRARRMCSCSLRFYLWVNLRSYGLKIPVASWHDHSRIADCRCPTR